MVITTEITNADFARSRNVTDDSRSTIDIEKTDTAETATGNTTKSQPVYDNSSSKPDALEAEDINSSS